MDRRHFLRLLGLGAASTVAALTLDPERLLWVPGAKTIFLPSVELVQPTSFLTIEMITREALRLLKNNLEVSRHINRSYDDGFHVEGANIGTVLNIRRPARYGSS